MCYIPPYKTGGGYDDAILNDDVVIVVAVAADPVFDQDAVDITLLPDRPPAVADVGLDVDDAERGVNSVFDPFAQAVGIERTAEVVDVRDIPAFLRGRGNRVRGKLPAKIPYFGGFSVAFVPS